MTFCGIYHNSWIYSISWYLYSLKFILNVFYHIQFICINAPSLLESFAVWNQTVSYNTNKKWKINSQKECIEYKIQGNLCQEGNWIQITKYLRINFIWLHSSRTNTMSFLIQLVVIYSMSVYTVPTKTHTHTRMYACRPYIWKDAWIQALAEHHFSKSEPNPMVRGGGVMKIWPIP